MGSTRTERRVFAVLALAAFLFGLALPARPLNLGLIEALTEASQ